MLRFVRQRPKGTLRPALAASQRWQSTVSIDYHGQHLQLETGKLAPIVDGAVVAR